MKLELSDIQNMEELKKLKEAREHYVFISTHPDTIGTMKHRMADDTLNYAERMFVNKFKEWIDEGLI